MDKEKRWGIYKAIPIKTQNKESYLLGIAVTFFLFFAVSLIVCAWSSKYHKALLTSLKTLCPLSCDFIVRNGFCFMSLISSLCSAIFLSFSGRVLRMINVGFFLINTSTIKQQGSFAVLVSPLDSRDFESYNIFDRIYKKYFVGKRNSFINVNRSLFFSFNQARNKEFYCYSIFSSIIDIREYLMKTLKIVYSLNFVVDSDFFFAVFYDQQSDNYCLCISHLFYISICYLTFCKNKNFKFKL